MESLEEEEKMRNDGRAMESYQEVVGGILICITATIKFKSSLFCGFLP